jgi:hypothetical protein
VIRQNVDTKTCNVTSRARGFADRISPTDTDTDSEPVLHGYLSDASSNGDRLAHQLKDRKLKVKPNQKPGASQRLDQIEGYLQSLKVAQAKQLQDMMNSFQQAQVQAQKQQLSLISQLSKDLRPPVAPTGDVSSPEEDHSTDDQVNLHASASEFEEEKVTPTFGPGNQRKPSSSTSRIPSKAPRQEEPLPAESDEQEVITFAKRKRGIAQLIGHSTTVS